LRRDGHEVRVLERDREPAPAASPEDAWEGWSRDGVTQFRQAHYLASRGREVLEQSLPDVVSRLEAAGAVRFDPLGLMPPSISDRAPREGDHRYWTLNARRPVLEQVFAQMADADVRRGTSVTGLDTASYDGTPHVTGVRTDAGEQLEADLVVDAMGRRSPLPRWLAAEGARAMHEESEDSGFIYYSRFFRSRNGALPEFRAALLTPIGTFSLLILPSDNATWSVTLYTASGDQPLKRLRDAAHWNSLVAACPLHAQWLDGEPLTDVLAMGGVLDRYRRLIVDGRPVATGVALLGDAWACTNPSLGRGVTLGLLHAQRLPAVIRDHLDDPHAFAMAWDALTEAELTPWYRETVEEDRDRLREIEALRLGLPPQPPRGNVGVLGAALLAAVPLDADAFRAFIATRSCLTRFEEIAADEPFVQRVFELAQASEPPPLAGPDRDALLGLLEHAPAAV
jgi:2-polyprenyl-6-methoxyphenol hydroxylase-like FAD-dependent oxidoreductase